MTIIDRTLLPGRIRPVSPFVIVAICAILGGCAGLPAQYDAGAAPRASGPKAYGPLPQQALADEIYLDGTGPSTGSSTASWARRPAREARMSTRSTVETTQIAPIAPVAHGRPTAIPRADVLSSAAATTPRPADRSAAEAPDTPDWLEREKAADARLRDKLRICRGC